ncbi:MAG: single-stranded DNA-binding protein [Clostridiales bacterium]|jgi:single-stranded DNA-binding protein|nr:single-stranded DNA-binding protein [Clostridiales bacterium]
MVTESYLNAIYNNNITVIGTVASEPEYSHEVFGERFYNFNIEVRRLSDVYDILPVTISERILDLDTFMRGACVAITGQIRSYNNYVEDGKRNRLILTIFVRDLEIMNTDEITFEEQQNPNEVFLNGFICKPPIYRTTPFGREIADILIAVNRSYNKSDYIPCIAWGRNARFSGRLQTGDNIKLWGRMQSRAYQKKQEDGSAITKTAFEVSIAKLELAEPDPEPEDESGYGEVLI